jgi:geranylgeranyl diphosphate synthase type I
MSSSPEPVASSASATASASTSAFLAASRAAVDARLSAILARLAAAGDAAGPPARAIADEVASLVRRGGKRLRPALVAAGHVAIAGLSEPFAPTPAVVDVGCALELLQAYFLIHDDWMDGDEVRRGGTTAHVSLARAFGGDHLGASLAVLAGDLASAEAHRVIAELPAPAESVRDATVIFVRMHGEVVLGQAIDLTLVADDEAAVERMHDLKTGSYTVRGPLALGAALAGASASQRAALDAWARPLGVAFQLRDDLLGAFGEPAETGKPVGSDLRAHKRTALIAAAHRLAHGDDASALDALFAAPVDDDGVARGLAILERCGARAEVERSIERHLEESETALARAEVHPAGRRLLRDLARRLAARSA